MVAVLALSSACGEDHDLPNDQTWESAHFRYHTRAGDPSVCQGVLAQLEWRFETMQGYLGLSWRAGQKVDYYKFRDQNDYAKNAPCLAGSDSCAQRTSVMSAHVLQEHELIHAILAPSGLPPSFFEEGTAVVLSCGRPWDERAGTMPWRDAVMLTTLDADPEAMYKTAGWFVGYLLDRYGPVPFLVFRDRLKNSASAETIARTFQETYGDTLDAAWDAASAAGARVGCVHLWPCQGPPLVLDGTPQTLAQACDGSDATRTFELAADTDLMMSYNGMPYDAPIRCDSSTFVGVSGYYTGIAQPAVLAHVTAGRYFVRAAGWSGDVPIRALPTGAYARDCAQAQPVDLGTREFTRKRDLDLTIPNDGQPWFVKLHVPGDWQFWSSATTSEHLMVCPTCGDLGQCHRFRGDVPLDGEGNAILRLTAAVPVNMTDSGYTTQSLGYKRRVAMDAGAALDAGAEAEAVPREDAAASFTGWSCDSVTECGSPHRSEACRPRAGL